MEIKLEFVSVSNNAKSWYCSVFNQNGFRDFFEIEKINGSIKINKSVQNYRYDNNRLIDRLVRFGDIYSEFMHPSPEDEFEFNLYKPELESFIKNKK